MNNDINKLKTRDLPSLPSNWQDLQKGYSKGKRLISVWKCGEKRVLVVYAEGESNTRSLVDLINGANPVSDSVTSFVRREVRRLLKRQNQSPTKAT